jgi:chromosomal replication initiator protein
MKNPLNQEKLFNPRFNFENFVVGNSNKYAHAVSVAVAEAPGEIYNPLFIYGGSGLGKTHLMQAIGVHIIRNNPSTKVLYVSTEMFTNELITAINDNKTRSFRNKYRKVDVLLIDDIQFLQGKEATQEEFFHTFETLYQNNKQIVITSDCPPVSLKGLDERLRTRFSWNMIADIQPPDYETRVAILKNLAEKSDLEMTSDLYDVLCMIADQVKDNIRELEGAYNRVIGLSQLLNEKITVDNAKSILKDIIKDNEQAVAPERIRSTVANHYKIKIADMDSPKRNAEITLPRQVAMYLCRETTDLSLPKIGKLFGNRHYSTVIHAVEKIEDEMKYDEELRENVETIKAKLNIGRR